MAGSWIAKALGKTQAVEVDSTHASQTLLLVLGRNAFGDDIYTYITLPTYRVDEIREKLAHGGNFVPAHYGTVVAAGRGKPTPDITDEVGLPEFMIYFKPKAEPRQLQPQPSQKGGY